MAGIRTSGTPVGMANAHAPARLRRAATPGYARASVCDHAKSAVVEQGTWFAIVGIDGRLMGLEGDGTG